MNLTVGLRNQEIKKKIRENRGHCSLLALNTRELNVTSVSEARYRHAPITGKGIQVTPFVVPSHIGLSRTRLVDALAKFALDEEAAQFYLVVK